MTDLIHHLKSITDKIGDNFELQELAPGDEFKVITTHTEYMFEMVDGRVADLTCSRLDRPHARVTSWAARLADHHRSSRIICFVEGIWSLPVNLTAYP